MIDTKVYTFLKVAEYGSFTAAARSLNLTQPAVSQHMHALENDLGVKLTIRSGNTIRLTEEGEKALAAARTLASVYSDLKAELSEASGAVRELTVGITHTMESNRIAEVLARYAAQNTGVRIRLLTGPQESLLQQLDDQIIDLAFLDRVISDENLICREIDTDRLMLIVSPSHALARRDSVTVDDIRKEKMILRLPESGTGNLFFTSLRKMHLDISDFNIILEVDNIATIKDLIRQGYGVSVLARSACMDELVKHKLTALPIDQMNMERNISAVCRRTFPYMNFLQEIIDDYKNENLPLAEAGLYHQILT